MVRVTSKFSARRLGSRMVFGIALCGLPLLLAGCQPSLFQNDNRVVKSRAMYFPDSQTVRQSDQQRRRIQGAGMGSPMGPAGY